VTKLDMSTRQVVRTVGFAAGSKPHMLRVSPDGKEVWVQTAAADTNIVLDADDLSVLATEPTGKTPVTNAWTPDNRYSLITHSADTYVSVFDARTFREVAQLPVGGGAANIGFTSDGSSAFISVVSANHVAVVDLARLEVAEAIPVGTQPQGLIIR